jgi:surfactin synthase thioesterase subunit
LLFADIIYTIQVLRAQRQRCAELQVSRLPPLPCDFTWIVGNADSLTTMDRCQFQVITDRLLCLVPCFSTTALPLSQDLTTASFERIVFPGGHFFVFKSKASEAAVADECIRLIERSLL